MKRRPSRLLRQALFPRAGRREAQAMARLSHPNIVAVHEVGAVDDALFVATEFVHGVTLHAWLEELSRPWREVVAVFIQAGYGLAAAHRAGLVHRRDGRRRSRVPRAPTARRPSAARSPHGASVAHT